MSDETSSSPQSAPRNIRRSSFAGQTFADIFGGGSSNSSSGSGSRPSIARGSTMDNPPAASASPPSQQQQPVGPISKAAQQAQQRRLSLTTLGLSGSPNQTSPFNNFRSRGDSIGSSSGGGSFGESAIAEDEAPREQSSGGGGGSGGDGSPTNTPFARRTSFGAKALREIRSGSFSGQGGGGSGGNSPGSNGTDPSLLSSSSSSASKKQAQNGTISSRDAKGRGSTEGFNWSDNLRSRVERTSSIAGQGGGIGAALGVGGGNHHGRAQSVANLESPPVAPPKPKEKPRPDHFQERILKGDFYMD